MFGYDAQHRVTSIERGAVGSGTFLTSFTFTYASGTTTVEDGRGNDTIYTIDGSGRVTAVEDALGRTRSQTWTANSDVATATDAFASGGTPGNTPPTRMTR